MSVGGQDFVVLAEVFVDRFGLRGRLDDDKFHAGYLSKGASDGRVGEAMSRLDACQPSSR
jgi:hypothetical protein